MTTLDAAPTTAAEILSRARDAAIRLRERSTEIEEARRLPPDVVSLLRDTGVFRMVRPKTLGGPELNPMEQTEVIEVLATGDVSAAWCAMIGMDTPIYANFLDGEAADALLRTPDMITAGLILPVGRAERAPGGFQVTGRWPFGSGITHADWVVAGCFVYKDGELEPGPTGAPMHWRIMIVPRDEVEVLEGSWDTTGLAGSGSYTYTMDDHFVPMERAFRLDEPRRTGPQATPDAILRNSAGVPLGVARAALDFVRGLAAERVYHPTETPWPEAYHVQMAIAEAEMDLGAARDYLYGGLAREWEKVQAGAELTLDERAETVLARVNSFRAARRVVSRLYDLIATTAIYKPSPMDRWLRDVNTMCQHVMAQDQVVQSAGAHLLGGTPHNPFIVGIIP
ncbi:acyl-CoA dehydrogenase family protein [Actinophytocola sp.]|uniref:acyl-CoA dehydrogenase family protein n=1 Tax=Actinophytocola sp. TaxID=1872138 RepID=UPI003D6BACFF